MSNEPTMERDLAPINYFQDAQAQPALGTLWSEAERRALLKGKRVPVEEGEVLLVQRGVLEVYSDDLEWIEELLMPGDYFFVERAETYIRCWEKAAISIGTTEDFDFQIRVNRRLRAHFLAWTRKSRNRMRQRLSECGPANNLDTAVWAAFKDFARAPSAVPTEEGVTFRFTRGRLAQYAFGSREMIGRIVKKFVHEGRIELGHEGRKPGKTTVTIPYKELNK